MRILVLLLSCILVQVYSEACSGKVTLDVEHMLCENKVCSLNNKTLELTLKATAGFEECLNTTYKYSINGEAAKDFAIDTTYKASLSSIVVTSVSNNLSISMLDKNDNNAVVSIITLNLYEAPVLSTSVFVDAMTFTTNIDYRMLLTAAPQCIFASNTTTAAYGADNKTFTCTIPGECSFINAYFDMQVKFADNLVHKFAANVRPCIHPTTLIATAKTSSVLVYGLHVDATDPKCCLDGKDITDARLVSGVLYCDVATAKYNGKTVSLDIKDGSKTINVGSVRVVDGCEAGKYGYNCELCPIGTYRPANEFTCNTCGPCSTTAAAGATEKTACACIKNAVNETSGCVCDLGHQYQSGECSQCPIGAYKESKGNTACTLCPATYTTSGTGSTSKNACTHGSDVPYTPTKSTTASGITTIILFVAVGPLCVVLYKVFNARKTTQGYAI